MIEPVEDRGLEHIANSPGNNDIQPPSAAKSGARGAREGASEPDLQALSAAWPELPDAIKSAILALVRAGGADQ